MVQWLWEESRQGKDLKREGGRGGCVCVCESDRPKHAMDSRSTFCYMCVVVQAHTNIPQMRNLYLVHLLKSFLASKWGGYFELREGILYITAHSTRQAHHAHTNKHWTKGEGTMQLEVNTQLIWPSPFKFLSPIPYTFLKLQFSESHLLTAAHLQKINSVMITCALSLANTCSCTSGDDTLHY